MPLSDLSVKGGSPKIEEQPARHSLPVHSSKQVPVASTIPD